MSSIQVADSARRQLSLIPELALVDVDDVTAMLARGGLRDSTIRRYRGAARSWITYCRDRGEPPHDASTTTLLRWLDWRCREVSSPYATLAMSLAATRFVQRSICLAHELEAVPYTGSARQQLDGFCAAMTLARKRPKRAKPLCMDELVRLLRSVRADLAPRRGVDVRMARWLADRDSAMVLVGWWGALRSDDLARLHCSDVEVCMEGLQLTLRSSKTSDEEAALALARRDDCPELCPWRAWGVLRSWGGKSERTGHAFEFSRSDHVRRRLRELFVKHGVRGYSGHSLRAGFATEAARQNVSDKLVQNHGRWLRADQHATYVRSGRLWLDTPTTRIVCPAMECVA